MRISDHIEEMLRNIESEDVPITTVKGIKNIIKKTSLDEWTCMEDFLGNVFSGLQQNIYNLENYGIKNEKEKYDNINKSIAKAIVSILVVKNEFSNAKKKLIDKEKL